LSAERLLLDIADALRGIDTAPFENALATVVSEQHEPVALSDKREDCSLQWWLWAFEV
jgi:hypothetical protein